MLCRVGLGFSADCEVAIGNQQAAHFSGAKPLAEE
jgi:hypothetical protein